MEILEDQEQWLDLAFAEYEAFTRIERPLPALSGVEGLPLGIVDGHIQEREEGR